MLSLIGPLLIDYRSNEESTSPILEKKNYHKNNPARFTAYLFTMHITDLANELLLHILQCCLTITSLVALASTCKHLHSILAHHKLPLFYQAFEAQYGPLHDAIRLVTYNNSQVAHVPRPAPPQSMDMATAHCAMSQISINYLNFDDFASISVDQLDQDDCTQQGDKPYFLLNYAALNWAIHHVSQGSERAKDSWSAAKNLCNILLPQHSYWFKIYCDSTYLESKDWTSLGIASLLELKYVAESFLNEGADVNAQGEEYGNALYAALSGGHDQVAQMLLDKGANISAP